MEHQLVLLFFIITAQFRCGLKRLNTVKLPLYQGNNFDFSCVRCNLYSLAFAATDWIRFLPNNSGQFDWQSVFFKYFFHHWQISAR